LLRDTNKERPIEVETVASNDRFLQCVAEHPFDLILTDSRQNSRAGAQRLREIRAVQPRARVIVLAGDSDITGILEVVRGKAFSLFCQPIDWTNLASMMASALDVESWEEEMEVRSTQPGWVALRLRPHIVTAERVYQFFKELAFNVPAQARDRVSTAFRELLMNAIEYGCGFQQDLRVDVAFLRSRRALLYQIRDPGPGFSLQSIPHAAISNPPDQPIAHMLYRMEKGMRDGGFGILIAHEMADELIFNEAGNEVLIVKYLD
jgi:anti-sigma regulatory factor (Ser/Thr protein kinase)